MAISELAFMHFTSKYKEEYCAQLLDHCSEGRSIESFCAKINSIPEALAYWSNKYPEFEVCLRVSYWKSYAWWEDQAIKDQDNIKEFKTLNPQLYMAVMKNRFRWRDSADDLMLAVSKMSDAELEERARRIIEAKNPQLAIELEREEKFINKRKKDGKI